MVKSSRLFDLGAPMCKNEKVVCIDDKFPQWILPLYLALPKKGVIYVIRNVSVGTNLEGEDGEVCVHLVGLTNPRSEKEPFLERGFRSTRFKPLTEVKLERHQPVTTTA